MTSDLLTPVDLAVLSALDDRPTPADQLSAGTLFASYWPNARALNTKLGALASRGYVAKTDTGGPVKQRRLLWAITAEGQDVIDAYRRTHGR